MIEWLRRHPHLTWSLAWGVTALGLYTADVASSPRLGPLWPAILFGAVAWSIAGATTLCGTRVLAGLFVWSAGYAIAFYLAATWTVGVQLGPTNLPEFVAALAAWAAGAAVATLVTTLWLVSRARPVLVVAFSVIWGVGFIIGGYVGMAVLPSLLR